MKRIVLLFLLFIVIPFKLISISEADRLRNRLSDSISDTERLETYYELAKITKGHSIDEAKTYIESALKIYSSLNAPDVEISTLLLLGDLYRENEDFLKAYRVFQQSLELSEKQNSRDYQIKSLLKIADFYYRIQEYDKSIEICNTAKKLNKKRENKLNAEILFYLGSNYSELAQYDLSRKYLIEAQALFIKSNNFELAIISIISIGKTYLNSNEFDQALEYQMMAVELAESNNVEWQLALAYNDLGWAYYKKDDFDKSLEYNLKSLELRQKLKGTYAETSSLLNIGILYKNYKHYPEAIEYINRAWIVAKNFPEYMLNNSKRRCSKNLYEIYESLGLNNEALRYLKIYNEAIINFDDQAKILEIEKLKATLRIESIKEQDLIRANHYKQKMILIITILTVLGLILFQIFYASFSEKKRQNSDLKFEIEDRKKIEAELKGSKDRLKILNNILRHDLANDIAVINSAINIYYRSPSEELLNIIQNRVKKIVGRIGYYKTYESMIDSNSNLITVDVNELIEELIPEFPELEILVEGAGKVLADEAIDSVFVNLFKNSIKHGAAKKIELKISTTCSTCRIEVSDDGIGVPDGVKEEIFKEGFIYGETGHTGIGLYIVKSTVENYDGSIYALDNEMGGVTFVITLNLAL